MTSDPYKTPTALEPIVEFKPAFWLPDGHSQTLWRKFAGAKPVAHRRQRLDLSDGDFIDLDWAEPEPGDQTNEEIMVLIVHGLCGCSGSSYVLALQQELMKRGMTSVAMNLRGCSGEINRKARTYHSGVSDDLAEVYGKLTEKYPNKCIGVVGYSLGANILLKWLGEGGKHDDSSGEISAVAVSTPFTLAECSRAMLSGGPRIYGRYFTRRLLESFLTKKQQFQQHGNQEELDKLRQLEGIETISNIWEFDDRVTAPLHGFADAQDYYQQCSSINYLSDIRANTLLIQSANDPMIPLSALPDPDELPATVTLELSRKGGHVGFIAGLRKTWLEPRIADFFLTR
ncbi:MAG: alpha/beta fold hydrolase [Gammaproteobacteria bacterium]